MLFQLQRIQNLGRYKKMIMNREWIRIWNDVIVACLTL
jgi:hypothetical protein